MKSLFLYIIFFSLHIDFIDMSHNFLQVVLVWYTETKNEILVNLFQIGPSLTKLYLVTFISLRTLQSGQDLVNIVSLWEKIHLSFIIWPDERFSQAQYCFKLEISILFLLLSLFLVPNVQMVIYRLCKRLSL